MEQNLTEETFFSYAMKHYVNSLCFSEKEFNEDLKRFKYLKRLYNRYRIQKDLKERLILNHIVILFNVFGNSTTRLLFFKLKGYYSILKPFLVMLNRLPKVVEQIEGKDIKTADIPLDPI